MIPPWQFPVHPYWICLLVFGSKYLDGSEAFVAVQVPIIPVPILLQQVLIDAPKRRKFSRDIRRFESRPFHHNNDNNNNKNAPNKGQLPMMQETDVQSVAILLAPAVMAGLAAVMAGLAFGSYKMTAEAFHAFVDTASGHTWAPVDGGAHWTGLIAPALTGPVSSSLSLLFGTLMSMTVGSLYNRQNTGTSARRYLTLEDV
jgi:hypothetical protein